MKVKTSGRQHSIVNVAIEEFMYNAKVSGVDHMDQIRVICLLPQVDNVVACCISQSA